jgi:hypothetical protein
MTSFRGRCAGKQALLPIGITLLLTIAALGLAGCQNKEANPHTEPAAASKTERPLYAGVYVLSSKGLIPISFAAEAKFAAATDVNPPVIVSYGIDLNGGSMAPFEPWSSVGLDPTHGNTYYLQTEVKNQAELYYEYTPPLGKPLPAGVYSFFLREHLVGHKSSYFFKLSPKEISGRKP